MQWVKKQKTGLLHRHPFERKSLSIKAKGRQSRSTGFAREFGWIVAGTNPSGRTLDLYIANDESPSQNVTVGLAEARPNNPLSFPAHPDHTSIQGLGFFCSLSTCGSAETLSRETRSSAMKT